jgi:hypothetical protein
MTKPSDVHGVEDGAPPPAFTKGRDLDETCLPADLELPSEDE